MKTYWLYYESMLGSYKQHFTTVFEFGKALDQAMDNSLVDQHSINFWTTEK